MTIRTFFISCLSLGCITSFSQKSTYKTYGDKKGIVYDLCFSKGGSWMVVPESTIVMVYDLKTDQVIYKLEGAHRKSILAVDLSSDSSLLVTGGRDSLVVLWDMKTQKALKTLQNHQGSVTGVKFSPDQRYVVTGSTDGTSRVYNLSSQTMETQFGGQSKAITTVAFSKDNGLLAYAGADKTIALISTATWKPISILTGHKDWIREIVFSSDSKRLLSCDDAGKIIIWEISDPAKPNIYYEFRQGYKWLLSIDLHTDGNTFVSGGLSGQISIDLPPSSYKYKLSNVLHKVRFLPNTGSNLIVAAATRGKGVILMNSRNMHFKTR